MTRRIAFLASLLLLALSGCASYDGSYYRDPYYADAYYDRPYQGDEGYYDQDGYYVPADDGYYGDYYASPDYDYYYDYGYTPFWGLDRYACGGWYSCSPYWNSYYRRPYSGWSLTYGNHWSWGSWGWYGNHWSPWYDDRYYHRPDPEQPRSRPRPSQPRALYREDARPGGAMSQGGEYLRPPGQAQPIDARPAPRPRYRDDSEEGRQETQDRPFTRRPAPRPLYRESPQARPASEAAAAPARSWYGGNDNGVRPASSPRSLQPEPSARPQPRPVYRESAEPRPVFREAAQPRQNYESRPRPESSYRQPERSEQPRFSPPPPRAEPRAERSEVRESRTESQNSDSDEPR